MFASRYKCRWNLTKCPLALIFTDTYPYSVESLEMARSRDIDYWDGMGHLGEMGRRDDIRLISEMDHLNEMGRWE